MTDIKSLDLQEITQLLREMGEPSFRGKQVFTWLHRGVTSFEEMSDLSKPLRQKLAERCYITVPTVERKQVSKHDGTVKYLWRLRDGNCIETVLMRYHHGNTVCISSQVGCRMGCAFCASTIAGKVRDLTPSEILDQVLFTQLDSGLAISNIVLMGIGEPLDNKDNVLKFLALVNSPNGLNIGMRHISLSTCGIVPQIDALAELNLQLTLSVSLHAPDSETRSQIMPVNRAYDVEQLFAACHRYFQKTGRRISFEYAMIDGVNDHDWQADLIAQRIKGMPGHVNLIPLNEVPSSPAAAQPLSRSGWSPMALPPRCGAVWVAILTRPAASCAARLWRRKREHEDLGHHRYGSGAVRESGFLRHRRGGGLHRRGRVRRYGRHQWRPYRQQYRCRDAFAGAGSGVEARYGLAADQGRRPAGHRAGQS